MSGNNGSLVPTSHVDDDDNGELVVKVNYNKMSPKKRLCVDILASNGFDVIDASERLKKTQKTIRKWWNSDENFKNAVVLTHAKILGINKLKRLNLNKLVYEKLSSELISRVSDPTQLLLMDFGEILKGLQYVDKIIRLDSEGEVTEKISTKNISEDIEERFDKRTEIDKDLVQMVACKDEEGNLHFVISSESNKNGLHRIEQ